MDIAAYLSLDNESHNIMRVCANLRMKHFLNARERVESGDISSEAVTDLHATLRDAEEWTRRWLEKHAPDVRVS